MRKSGSLLAKAFTSIFNIIGPDVVTAELDSAVERVIIDGGARPAFKGYKGGGSRAFPSTTCISIEEEVVHGIPAERQLKSGDIVGIDAGVELDGWYADMACSFLIGETDSVRNRLWNVTKEALYKGIKQARKGNYLEDISGAIQDHVEKNGFGIVRDLVGHGIGSSLHEDPQVPNYRQACAPIKLKSGMTLAIEPMVSSGDWRIRTLRDGWTAVTVDRSPAGHFEHTILITDDGPEILTLLEDGRDPWDLVSSSKMQRKS